MNNPGELSGNFIWRDGHLTDGALAMLGDGENQALPVTAVSHVESCDLCTMALGTAIVRSQTIAVALSQIRAAPKPPQRGRNRVRVSAKVAVAVFSLVSAAAFALWFGLGRKRAPISL